MKNIPMTLIGALDLSLMVTHEIYKDSPKEEHNAAIADCAYSFLKTVRQRTWWGRFFL